VSLNSQFLDNETKRKLIVFFSNLSFSCYNRSEKLSKPTRELISTNSDYSVYFIEDFQYWRGTKISFSGKSANYFYSLILENVIDWNLFPEATHLSRFDLYYDHPCRQSQSSDFLLQSYESISTSKIPVTLDRNQKGMILKIGSRRSTRFGRVYQRGESLRFELELKNQSLKKYSQLLTTQKINEFEKSTILNFYKYFFEILPSNIHTEWLVIKLRPIRKLPDLLRGKFLKADYIQERILIEPKSLVHLIKFINYLDTLESHTKFIMNNVVYRTSQFRLNEFLEYQSNDGIITKNQKRYKRQQIQQFLVQLQSGRLIRYFKSSYLQSLMVIPQLELWTCQKTKYLYVSITLLDSLFEYQYPFYLSSSLLEGTNKSQNRVCTAILSAYLSTSIEKKLDIQAFFEDNPGMSNQEIANTKKYFITTLTNYTRLNLITGEFVIFKNGIQRPTKSLKSSDIKECLLFYEQVILK
jgi:hypothetical protein